MRPLIERVRRYLHASYLDARMYLAGKQEPDLPPLRLRFVGAGDFREVGQQLVALTREYGRVEPDSRVLDIGCGSGRLAIPMTTYLRQGTYEGFDVVGAAVRWCQRHITTRHPHFRFTHVRARNSEYALSARSAATLRFPYPDAQFDCVVAYSVFTHLQYDEMQNYLRETFRVLRPGGRFVGTFFLLNEQSEAAQKSVAGVQQFPHPAGPTRIAFKTNPAFAVAVSQTTLREFLGAVGFSSVTMHPGSWYGVQGTPAFQDLLVCTR